VSQPGWKRKARGAARNLALAVSSTLLSLLLVLAAGEAYIRLGLGIETSGGWWIEPHESRGWTPKPGRYANFDPRAFRQVRLSINSLGLRDPELSLAIPRGKRRVTVVGDSFVFATALADGEHLTGRLQALAGPETEVINVSAEGYGTGQEILWLEDLAKRGYQVGESLVLVFFSNDLTDNVGLEYGSGEPAPEKPVFHVDAQGRLCSSVPRPPATAAPQRAWPESLFVAFLRSRVVTFASVHPGLVAAAGRLGVRASLPRMPGIVEGWYGPDWKERWRVSRDLIRYLDKLSKERLGTRLCIVYMPSPFQVLAAFEEVVRHRSDEDPRYARFVSDIDRPQRALRELCHELGVTLVDPSDDLRRQGLSLSPYLPQDGHLNEAGSKLVAEVTYRALRSSEIAADVALAKPDGTGEPSAAAR
jgi:hypothetical protein